jgi:hypothetical protein
LSEDLVIDFAVKVTVCHELQRLALLAGDLDAVKEKTEANFEWLMGGYTESIVERARQDLRILFEKSL